MDIQRILVLYDLDERSKSVVPGMRREMEGSIVRHVPEDGDKGSAFIAYSKLDEDVDDVIAAQVDYFQRSGHSFEWKVYSHDTPADLLSRLADRGFKVSDPEPILALDLEDVPQALLRPVTTDVRRVTEPERLADICLIMEQVWGGDFGWLQSRLGNLLTHEPDYVRIYVAYADGVAASAGWLFLPDESRFGSLWGGSTLATYRARGLYSALLAVRVQEARRRGYRFLTIDTSPMSQPIVEKHGFIRITTSWECQWQAPDGK